MRAFGRPSASTVARDMASGSFGSLFRASSNQCLNNPTGSTACVKSPDVNSFKVKSPHSFVQLKRAAGGRSGQYGPFYLQKRAGRTFKGWQFLDTCLGGEFFRRRPRGLLDVISASLAFERRQVRLDQGEARPFRRHARSDGLARRRTKSCRGVEGGRACRAEALGQSRFRPRRRFSTGRRGLQTRWPDLPRVSRPHRRGRPYENIARNRLPHGGRRSLRRGGAALEGAVKQARLAQSAS